jgi:hypothetical protein
MTPFSVSSSRTPEEAALFNPAFVSILVTRIVEGHRRESDRDPTLPIVFVATAIALDGQVRSTLTMTVRSHLGAWKYGNPAAAARIPQLCRVHRDNFRRGLMFGLHHRLVIIDGSHLSVGTTTLRKSLGGFSQDVEEGQRAAFFLGRWLSTSGPTASVMAILGVRA